jgi:hypothetical protein
VVFDYLITAGHLSTRRVGGKILIPASAVRPFARRRSPRFPTLPQTFLRDSMSHLMTLKDQGHMVVSVLETVPEYFINTACLATK